MKKETINLFVKFQFTSLSPDAMPVSLGIVSTDWHEYPTRVSDEPLTPVIIVPKSFYAEFSDYQIERCDDWVKENVVSKLKYYNSKYVAKLGQAWKTPDDFDKDMENICEYDDEFSLFGTTGAVKRKLNEWLKQFSDYQIQFITDCGTFDFYHLLQLIGEWEEKPNSIVIPEMCIPNNMTIQEFAENWRRNAVKVVKTLPKQFVQITNVKTGLPKLPSNISPVPFDLNDLIAIKKGITPKEAFDELRLKYCVELTNPRDAKVGDKVTSFWGEYEVEEIKTITHKDHGVRGNPDEYCCINGMYWSYADTILLNNVHNSLFDAKIIKTIYEKLI